MKHINLNEDQLTVIKTIQDFYHAYQVHPSMRKLIKHLKDNSHWGDDKACSIYLFKLFPDGPIMQASLLGGLPKPKKCL
jgi:tRNA 2-thiouridine synthesizing protein E